MINTFSINANTTGAFSDTAPHNDTIDSNSGSFITSEISCVKLRHRKAMTVKNLAAYLFNNGDPDTVTVHSRKNGANGNLTCSIGSSNVLGQDTSNSDNIAVGDDYDFSLAGQGNGGPL